MNEIDNFLNNFPLSFVSRDPLEQKVTNCPSSLTEAKTFILSNPNLSEKDPSNFTLYSLYLCSIGEFSNSLDFPINLKTTINDLIKKDLISINNYGFINEMDSNSRRNRVIINEEKIEQYSFHQLFRFCFSHGIHITHDISYE